MGATTTDAIVARIGSLLASQPYEYQQAKEPFSFELQPDQALDKMFCVIAELESVEAYLGPAQAEINKLTIRMARKIRKDATESTRLLYLDCGSLQSSVIADGLQGDYAGEVVDWRVPPPGPKDTHVIAEISLTADFDRAL